MNLQNNEMFKFFEELSVFNNIKYTDSNHSYKIGDQTAISGTQLIGTFEEHFDSVKQANITAIKRGVTPQSLLNEWTLTNILASTKGSYVHNYLELSFQKRVQEINQEELYNNIYQRLSKHEFYKAENEIILNDDTKYVTEKIIEYYEKIIPTCDRFLEQSSKVLLPLASEFIIGDLDYLVCGTIDQLYYNKKTKNIEIWDWKTNKGFTTENKYKQTFKYPINKISSCHHDHYSLQLNLYKYIIEKNTNLKIGNLWLVNFAETLNDEFVFYECKDYLKEVQLMLTYHRNKTLLKNPKKYGW